MKIHLIKIIDINKNIITSCGKNGWKNLGWTGEYDDERCFRFEATLEIKKVTCKACIKAMK